MSIENAGPPTPGNTPPEARRSWRDHFHGERFHADGDFARRCIIAILLVALALFLWKIVDVLLLLFAAILLAVLLRSFADLLAARTPISERWSLTSATLTIAVVLVVLVVLFGAQVATQLSSVAQRIPEAINSVGTRLDIPNAAASAEAAIRSGTGGLVSRMARFGYTALGALANLALVCVAAIYLAAEPALYLHGAAKLLPPSQHERFIDAMSAAGRALRLWVGGQLVSMSIVGVMSSLAYWAIGLPSPLGLGVIAALADFIPFVGPILGAFLPVVFSLNIGTGALLWTLAAIIAIQQIEGNVIVPLIQKRAVSMPPVLVLFAIVAFGLTFGPLGVILAVPLAAAIIVLVKKLWIREALGEETELPGER